MLPRLWVYVIRWVTVPLVEGGKAGEDQVGAGVDGKLDVCFGHMSFWQVMYLGRVHS